MNNIVTNELELASQGLQTLMEQGIAEKEKEIFAILAAFPTLKEATLADKEFQTQFFQSIKQQHLKHNYESDYDKHNVRLDWIISYAQKYDFLQELILQDEQIQDILQGKIRFEIDSLQGVASKYRDKECTEHTSDRLSSLLSLEKIYANMGVITENSREYREGILHMLVEWVKLRVGGTWFPRVLELAKQTGLSKKDLDSAIYTGWIHRMYNPDVLELEDFPKEILSNEEVQLNVWLQFKNHMWEADAEDMTKFYTSYDFLQENCKYYNSIVERELAKNISPFEDENLKKIIGNAVEQGVRKSLGRARPEISNLILGYFPSVAKVMPRSIITESVFKGLDAPLYNDNDKISTRTTLLQSYPLSQEEAEQYLLQHLEYQIKHCGTESNYYVEELRKLLGLFPGVNFDKVFHLDHIKASISKRLPHINKKEDKDFVTALTGVSEKTSTEIYIDQFIGRLQNAINPDNHHSRSYKIKDALTTLENSLIETSILRTHLETDEIKGLLHSFAQRKMSDRGWLFTDAFGNDKEIEELCTNPLFTLSAKELEEDQIALFFRYCKGGYYDGLDGLAYDYKAVKEKLASEDNEVVDACITGMTHLIETSLKSKYEVDHTRTKIWLFLHRLPFLRNSWNDDRIQKVIQEQAGRFLGEGEAEAYTKIKSWGKLEGIDTK